MVSVKLCGGSSENGNLQNQEKPSRGGGRPWAKGDVLRAGQGQDKDRSQVS